MKKVYFLMMLCVGFRATAQTIEKFSIDNGGSSTANGNIQLLYTIGEVHVQEASVNNILLSEGFINPIGDGTTLNTNHMVFSEHIKIYPNPVSETLYISNTATIDNIILYDSLGRLVYETQNTNQIHVSNFNKGVYFLNVQSEGKISVIKVIIK